MIEPIHTATIGGHTLRFFRTPNNDGKPDMPWHSVDDLYRCLGLDNGQRKYFLKMLRKRGFETVATPDGIVSIAPHYMAQACINAMIEKRVAPASIKWAYAEAGTEAMNKLIPPHLEYPSDAWMTWMAKAMKRHAVQR